LLLCQHGPTKRGASTILLRRLRAFFARPHLPDILDVGRSVEENVMEASTWPKCRKCGEGELVPLSDYGTEGATVTYKAWVCTNPACGFNLKIHKGNLYINEPVNERTTYNH
jgi:hypothetical protein